MARYKVTLREPHDKQWGFISSTAKRKVVRAGRRSGKTVGVGVLAVMQFLEGKRVLYATPTQDQVSRFWYEVKRALADLVDAGIFYKNETQHIIELPGTEQRIKAKTAWNADTLRGDYADVLILDEFQLMSESTWDEVGAPMLIDTDGAAIFIYTPPSLEGRWRSKARDPQYASKLFRRAREDTTGRWEAFHFTSHDNPYIDATAVEEIAKDMSALAYRMEILAEDVDEAPGALWTRATIEDARRLIEPELVRLVVAIDPSTTTFGEEAGIIAAGINERHFYVLEDASIQGSPAAWAQRAINVYRERKANLIVAEQNQGGEMVKLTIHHIDPTVPVKLVTASRGKQTRAEPVSAVYEQGRGHHVGSFPALEDEMCLWIPGSPSPNRMDALVWAASELLQLGDLSLPEKQVVQASRWTQGEVIDEEASRWKRY